MKAETKISPAWLEMESVAAVFAALNNGGDDDSVRFVGGCVRDVLLGHRASEMGGEIDIDLASKHQPDEVQKRLEVAGFDIIPSGIEHGTLTICVSKAQLAAGMTGVRVFEITTLRRDVVSDGRHAEVEWSDDWGEDASRRDFTINALYADIAGNVYDPLGCGLADISDLRLRFIGDASRRISEDYLRILRFFRFHFRLCPQVALDVDALGACRAARAKIADLSGERIQKELLALLALPDAARAIAALAEADILAEILPQAVYPLNHIRLSHFVQLEEDELFRCDPLLRLMALSADSGMAANALALRLKLTKKEKARLLAGLGDMPHKVDMPPVPVFVSYMSAREARRALYLLGAGVFSDRVLLEWSGLEVMRNNIQWRALLALAESWRAPAFPLNGKMMAAAGVPEGEMMGKIARLVEAWWIDTDFTDDVFSIIERLKAITQALIY